MPAESASHDRRIEVDGADLDAVVNLVERMAERWPQGWHRAPESEREAFKRLRLLADGSDVARFYSGVTTR